MRRPRGVKSIETKHYEERDAFFRGLHNLDRRSFLKVSIAAAAAAAANGIVQNLHAFMPIDVANAQTNEGFRIAYISDAHLYERKVNERFVRSLLRAQPLEQPRREPGHGEAILVVHLPVLQGPLK